MNREPYKTDTAAATSPASSMIVQRIDLTPYFPLVIIAEHVLRTTAIIPCSWTFSLATGKPFTSPASLSVPS